MGSNPTPSAKQLAFEPRPKKIGRPAGPPWPRDRGWRSRLGVWRSILFHQRPDALTPVGTGRRAPVSYIADTCSASRRSATWGATLPSRQSERGQSSLRRWRTPPAGRRTRSRTSDGLGPPRSQARVDDEADGDRGGEKPADERHSALNLQDRIAERRAHLGDCRSSRSQQPGDRDRGLCRRRGVRRSSRTRGAAGSRPAL